MTDEKLNELRERMFDGEPLGNDFTDAATAIDEVIALRAEGARKVGLAFIEMIEAREDTHYLEGGTLHAALTTSDKE